MAYSNQADLAANVALYLHRKDLVAQIPDFINFATARLGRELRSMENERTAVFTMTQNPQALPTDFKGIRQLTYPGTNGELYIRSGSLKDMAAYSGQRAGNQPGFYIIVGGALMTAPTRLGDYNLTYWYQPPALTLPTDSNAVLLSYPMLYLYAAIMEGFFFAQDGEMYSGAKQNFIEELKRINIQNEQIRMGANPAMRSI